MKQPCNAYRTGPDPRRRTRPAGGGAVAVLHLIGAARVVVDRGEGQSGERPAEPVHLPAAHRASGVEVLVGRAVDDRAARAQRGRAAREQQGEEEGSR